MLVRKANADPSKPLIEQFRIVHDYRRLNENTIRDSYPMQNLTGLLDSVSSGKIWTAIDLSSGFWQQMLDPGSREKTAFGLPSMGHFEYIRSPQGLCNSPAAFQRLLDYIIRGVPNCFCYIDDVLCVATTHEEHLAQLEQLFVRFRSYGLKIRVSKFHLAAQNIDYLGFNISKFDGIRPSAAKTKAIDDWKPPRDVTQVKQFLGLCNFYRKSLHEFSFIASPLTKLTRKDLGWSGGELPQFRRKR